MLPLDPIPTLIGIVIFGLALVIMLTLPFSNLPSAVALFCLSLGLIKRDELMIAIGLLVGLTVLVIEAEMAAIAFEAVAHVFHRYFS